MTGEVYSGRTSVTGTLAENVRKRDANHHMNSKGFGLAILDKTSDNYQAIRGREQMLIDYHGGAKSKGGTSGNAINGIGPNNKKKEIYINAAKGVFGNLEKNRKRRLKLGDIYEIQLPNGMNAYGRLFKECTLAIYDIRCNDVSELPENEIYQCYVAVYKDLLQDGEWKIVGNREFASEDDAWAPPKCVIDGITKIGSLYYKGILTPCSYDECKDLEIAAVWDKHHLIDRLMGNNVWEKSMGRPQDPNK